MKLKVYDDSKNYTCVVVKLTNSFPLQGLDNLVGVSVFGNTCLIPKTYDLSQDYIFFPSETQLDEQYLKANNLYREASWNADKNEKGYFELHGRIKAIKFKGNKSTGVVMPITSLIKLKIDTWNLKVGDEFNEINGIPICKKYVVPTKPGSNKPKQVKLLDELIDSRNFPEHHDTEHLLKNLDRIELKDHIVITEKIHGTSARTAFTLVKRKLTLKDKIAKFFGVPVITEEYKYVVGSRRVVKSIDFQALDGKRHYYSEDLWTKVAKECLEGKLHKGEAVYYEIVGLDYNKAEIQSGYSYGYNEPKVFVYRITHINPQGIEIDLPWRSVVARCHELGLITPPTFYMGKVKSYPSDKSVDWRIGFEEDLKKTYLDVPSILNENVVSEGICLRVDTYNPKIYKLKSPEFLIHEGKLADKLVSDIESNS